VAIPDVTTKSASERFEKLVEKHVLAVADLFDLTVVSLYVCLIDWAFLIILCLPQPACTRLDHYGGIMINSWLAAIESAIRHLLGVAPRPLLSLLMLGLSLCLGAGQVRAQCGSLSAPSTTWQNGGNSFWNLDGNWTSGIPTASTNACILNGTSTVTLSAVGSVLGLKIATGNTLIISGAVPGGAGLMDSSGGHVINNGAIGMNMGGLFNSSDAVFINNGSISGAFANLSNSGTFTNKSTISLVGDSGLSNNTGASFVNSGTITGDSLGFLNQGTFSNKGTMSITSQFDPSSFANSGTFNNSGTISLSLIFNSSSFSNTGTFNNKGKINLDDSCAGGCSISVTNSGTLNNRGALNITSPSDGTGLFTNSGTINNSSGGTLSNALTSTLDNTGTINNTSGAHLNNLGTLTNEGIFNSGAHLMDTGTFNNTGTFSNSGAVTISNTGLFTTSTDYTQTGGRTIVNGTLTATGGAIVDIEGGKLGGTGTINGDVLMKGIMTPGSSGASGTFTVNGNYQQTAAGVFDEIIKSSSANGLLDVAGLLALDSGSLLEITLQGGFDPVGDSFTILDYGSLSGEFGNGTSFMADGFNWTLTYGSNDAILTAVSADPPVNAPEPGTISLIALGFLPLLGYAAKRRTVGRGSIDLRQAPRI